IAPLRRALRIRTIFNLMGAIGNPARPHFHLLGVAEDNLIRPMAHALKALGTRRAMGVRGGDHRALVIKNLDDAVRVLRGALDGGAGPAQVVLALNGGAAIYVGGM